MPRALSAPGARRASERALVPAFISGGHFQQAAEKGEKLLWLDSTGAPVPGVVVVGGGPALNGAPQRTNGGANAGGNLSVERDLFTAIEKFTYFGRACHPLES
jgi:hypothetical protein